VNLESRNEGARAVRELILLASSLVLATMGFSGCQTQSMGGGNPPPVLAATISLCDDGISGCPTSNSFSAAAMRDLVIKVGWENLPAGNHVQTTEILIPGGGLYQSTRTAFLIEDGAPGSLTTKRILPVAGTWIPQRQITGNWSVRVSLDGQIIASQTVELNP
jgi:hypothetical protein